MTSITPAPASLTVDVKMTLYLALIDRHDRILNNIGTTRSLSLVDNLRASLREVVAARRAIGAPPFHQVPDFCICQEVDR